MMIGLLTMLAVVSAVLVWQWRPHRGPVIVTALWLGQIAAGTAASGVGAALAHWRYGTADHQGVELSPENRVHYFTEARRCSSGTIRFQVAVTLLMPAAVAALVYAFMTVATRATIWAPGRGGSAGRGRVGVLKLPQGGTEPVRPASPGRRCRPGATCPGR